MIKKLIFGALVVAMAGCTPKVSTPVISTPDVMTKDEVKSEMDDMSGMTKIKPGIDLARR